MDRLGKLNEKVRDDLNEMGLEIPADSGAPLVFQHGSTLVTISTFEIDASTFCRISSIVLTDVTPTLELLQRLLRLNTEVLFGAFLLFEDTTVAFSATLLGNDLDPKEFETTLRYVAAIADTFDDPLLDLCGGMRGMDLLEQVDADR